MEELFFYKGNENVISKTKDGSAETSIEKIKEAFSKVLDGKNLSFLLGCGCSSFSKVIDSTSTEIGIPTMVVLAKDFYTNVIKKEEIKWLKDDLKLDISQLPFANNLESFLGALHSIYFFYEVTGQVKTATEKDEICLKVKSLIVSTRDFLVEKCLNEANKKDKKDDDLINLYKSFYRKLLYRNSNLPKPNIFTTNYDLYNETALDKLGIHYVNGFSGGVKKYFNPTIFNYALAEKMDLSQGKWNIIDNFVYLYKLHGSLNWIQNEDDEKLFKVSEIQDVSTSNLLSKEVIMIHPTPLKQSASMGSPYSDLFREFQKKLMQNNNVLVTIGYSFSDEHINNLIYQAFTIPSFRLIVLGNPNSSKEIEKLKSLDDPRIWIIGGTWDKEKLNYFNGFVSHILPDLSNEQMDDKIENAIKTLLSKHE